MQQDRQGIFRAAVGDPARTPLYWAQLMRWPARVDSLVCVLLTPDLPADPTWFGKTRVHFLQSRGLVNAVVNDSGPGRLHDPALAPELARSLMASARFTAPAG